MYNDFKKKSYGSRGGDRPSYGGGAGGDRGGWKRDGARGGFDKPMFPATCATCGTSCEVPFKPNGRKPVLCSNCFKKEGPSEGGRDFGGDRPMRSERPTYSAPGEGNISQQLKDINDKLDAIIHSLND